MLDIILKILVDLRKRTNTQAGFLNIFTKAAATLVASIVTTILGTLY